MTTQIRDQARELAERTDDAYSFDLYYKMPAWRNIARYLLEQGYSDAQAEQILRSKYMRWASDAADAPYRMTLPKFIPFFEKQRAGIDHMLRTECGL